MIRAIAKALLVASSATRSSGPSWRANRLDARVLVKPCRLIPGQAECYGTPAVDYKKTVMLTGTTTLVTIPRLARYGEVNVDVDTADVLVGDTKYGAGWDICWPVKCAG